MTIDLNREAEKVRAQGAKLAREGWLSDSAAPSQVAAYIAASDRIDSLSLDDVIHIVRQGLDVDVASRHSSAVCGLARDVLLTRVRGAVALSAHPHPDI